MKQLNHMMHAFAQKGGPAMKTRPARMLSLALALMLLGPLLCAAEETGGAPLAEGAELRIMSYNILHPDWSRVPVKGRDGIVAAILSFYRPDVAALQEAGAKWHKALAPLLVEPGLYAAACRKSNAEGFIYCTTCFLYNPQTVRVAEEYILDLDRRDASRVLSVAVFERLADGARFVMANTHPAPSDEQPENYARNMADLTALAAEVRQKYAGLPIVFAGDFNTPEQAEWYRVFMEKADVRDAKYEAEVLALGCSTYFGWQGVPDPEDTDLCIDHLFVGDEVDVKLFSAVIGHEVENASDHIPIYMDIALTQPVY